MVKRDMENKLLGYAKAFRVIFINGPRQSGKTTLVRKVFPKKPYVLLEDIDTRDLARSDPRKFLARYPNGAIFDEIQECPDLLSYMLGIVDEKKLNGMFILTGSQNILLLEKVKQSLAGRMGVVDVLPFSLHELAQYPGSISLDDLLYKGSFPRIWNENIDPTDEMKGYVKTYLERDVRGVLDIKNMSRFRKFFMLCATRVGQLMNHSSICNDLGVSSVTVQKWFSVLEASNLAYVLPPFYENLNKRVLKTPKLYFIDCGLVSYLLKIASKSHLQTHPLYGEIFENFVVGEIRKLNFSRSKLEDNLFFFRDKTGNEVDMIHLDGNKINAVEIKSGMTFSPYWLKGLLYIKRLAPEKIKSLSLIYAGKESFETGECKVWGYRDIEKFYDSITKG